MRTENIRRSKAGFTMAEMLIAVLILLMVSAVLAAGVPVAVNAYNKVIDAANAQLLLSTTVTRIDEELSTAVEVWTSDGKVTAYSHYRNGYKISLKNVDNQGINLDYELRHDGDTIKIPDDVMLVTGKTETEKFFVKYGEITYNNGVFTVNNLQVIRKADSKVQVEQASLNIRTVKQPDLNPIT